MYFAINGKNVKSIDYDMTARSVKVLFQNNRQYIYYDVPATWIVKFLGSEADKVPQQLGKEFKFKEM